MSVSYRVISIGTLSRNRLWDETAPKRVSHSTTTLIRTEGVTILVDPGLPEQLMTLHMDERAGMTPGDVDVVFLTTFRPVHRRSLGLFEKAAWLMYEPEIEAVRHHLDEIDVRTGDDPESRDVAQLVSKERLLLDKMKPAQDRLVKTVHLYPSPGITPGAAGLLLALPSKTVIVAGDAVVTQDYYEAGRIFEQVADLEQARESFSEILETADEIVPGHDNIFAVPGR